MRRWMMVSWVAVLAVVGPLAARADEPEAKPERVWQGYLFRDGEGRTRVGWAVVAMGVIAEAAHVIDRPLADQLAPLLTPAREDYLFWNYTLAANKPEDVAQLPRFLVRLRGKVAADASAREQPFGGSGVLTLEQPQLDRVERIDPTWLAAWGPLFRGRSFARYHEEDATVVDAAAARESLAALLAMRAVPGPSDALRAEVRAIAPDAVVGQWFRRSTEQQIQRWLLGVEAKHAFGLELAGLGPLPPTATDVQAWFLASADRAAFLARVSTEWAGALDEVPIPYYESAGNSTWYGLTDALEVQRTWTDADYVRRLATTRGTLDK